MGKRFIKRVISVMLCTVTLLCFGGCFGHKQKPSPVSGGTVDKTDYDAPKIIESKEITDFSASFFLRNEKQGGWDGRKYSFKVYKNESGVLTAEEEKLKISAPADDKLLKALQGVIDEQKLVQKNGICKYTSGLAPAFQPCNCTVNYASGEKLTFTENNNPEAEWAQKIYSVFAEWFAENGDDTLLPEDETETATESQP